MNQFENFVLLLSTENIIQSSGAADVQVMSEKAGGLFRHIQTAMWMAASMGT